MITLYTPATGFPDLEAKIAYGLARVGIEAFGTKKVRMKNMHGFFQILIEGDMGVINETFNLLCQRILSSTYIPFNTPGITSRSAETLKASSKDGLDLSMFKSLTPISQNKISETVCRHPIKNKIGNVIGFAASTSYHHSRDRLDISIQQKIPRRPTNPKSVCKVCGLLSLLGMWYTSLIFNISDIEVMIVPMPKRELTGYDLQRISSLQHKIRKEQINERFSQRVLPLVLLSRIPSSAEILSGFDLFIVLLSKQQGYHVDGLYQIPIDNYLTFIKATPYNPAIVEFLLKKKAYNSLDMLNRVIFYHDVNSLPLFVRHYSQETSTNNSVSLLYPDTTAYLLKEVAMIKPEIIENPGVQALARTLRYFVRERKYTYVDDIRNAREDSRDFETTLAKMLREAKLRRDQQEQDKSSGKEVKNWVYVPKTQEIQEIFRLAKDDFESLKMALVILSFTYPQKEGSHEDTTD